MITKLDDFLNEKKEDKLRVDVTVKIFTVDGEDDSATTKNYNFTVNNDVDLEKYIDKLIKKEYDYDYIIKDVSIKGNIPNKVWVFVKTEYETNYEDNFTEHASYLIKIDDDIKNINKEVKKQLNKKGAKYHTIKKIKTL